MKLIHGDCLEEMPKLPDNSIDMILCDLPYGITACKWDAVIPFEPLWKQYKRLIKDRGAIVLTASQPFTSALVMSNPKMFKYCWAWDKGVGTGFMIVKHRPLKCHEDVLVFYGKQPVYNPQKWQGKKNHVSNGGSLKEYTAETIGKVWVDKNRDSSGMKYPRSVISIPKFATVENEHPTQKPVALFEYLIRTYTNEGDMVMDNCMGSGTTGVACVNLNRDFIGIELDKKYFNTAKQRIKKAQHNQSLKLIKVL